MYKPYQITERQRENARRLGVEIRLIASPNKKLDVFKDGKRIASIGAKGYADYDVYLRERGKEYADRRRALYKIRHADNRKVKGSPGWYADQILW